MGYGSVAEAVIDMRNEKGMTYVNIGKEFGVTGNCISDICSKLKDLKFGVRLEGVWRSRPTVKGSAKIILCLGYGYIGKICGKKPGEGGIFCGSCKTRMKSREASPYSSAEVVQSYNQS